MSLLSLKKYMTVIQEIFAEETSQVLDGVLLDDQKPPQPIPGSALTAMTMTLSNAATGAIINGREDANILGTNGGSVDPAGNWLLELTPNDMVILDNTQETEVHLLLIEWVRTGGKKGKSVIVLTVGNLSKVP
jgi:hypothetical protein